MVMYLRSILVTAAPEEPVFIVRLFEPRTQRAMTALFLAVLEMVKLQAIVVLQKDLFGEIAVQRHQKFDAVFATDQPVSAIEKDYN